MADIPYGWATVAAAFVTAMASIVAILITIRTRTEVRQVGNDARAVRDQVQNSHTTNMREESDERHRAILAEFGTIKATQRLHGRQIGTVERAQRGMQRDIGRLADADQEQVRSDHRLGERLTDLERTQPNSNQPNPKE